MEVVVGSQNPVKVSAVEAAFAAMFPKAPLQVSGISVPSGVADQPMGDEETQRGALNRAEAVAIAHPGADYAVGIEGGCANEPDGRLSVFAWMVVRAADGRIGTSKTSVFYLPREVTELIAEGHELGDADDIVFGRDNSKQAGGSVGLLTGNVVTRHTYYEQALVLALIPFVNPNLTF